MDRRPGSEASTGGEDTPHRFDTPKHADLVYDVGMHKGEDTDFYLRKGFRVVGFEANPELAESCRNRFRKSLDSAQLTVIEGAIVGRDVFAPDKKVTFYRSVSVSPWGTVTDEWAKRNSRLGVRSEALEVDVVDLVAVIRQHGIPHYLKIDIEGQDMACVDVLSSFEQRPSYVSIESDKTGFAGIRREIDAMAALGYDSFQAVEQSTIPRRQTPPYPAGEGAYVAHDFEKGCSGLFGAELDGTWLSRRRILRKYRVVRLGYRLLGDDGLLTNRHFLGASILASAARRALTLLTRAKVPGWYDTHARHRTVRRQPG